MWRPRATRSGSRSAPAGAVRTTAPVATRWPICRRSAGSNAPKVRRSSGTISSNASAVSDAIHASSAPSSWSSWTSTVPLPARKPSTNAAPAAAGVPGLKARPRRASTASVSHPPPSWSNRVARPCTRPWTRRVSARRASTVGNSIVPSGVVDDTERGLHGAQPFDHRSGGVLVQPDGGAIQPGQDPHDEFVEDDLEATRVGPAHVAVPHRRRQRPQAVHQIGDVGSGRRQSAQRLDRRTDGVGQLGQQRQIDGTSGVGQRGRRHRLLDQPRRRRRHHGGAVPGPLDQPHRQLGLPPQRPRLAKGARASPPLGQRAPPDVEGSQPVQQPRPTGSVGAPQIQLDLGAGRLEPEPGRLGRCGEISSQRHLGRVGGHLADAIADHEFVLDDASAHPSRRRRRRALRPIPARGRVRIAASDVASRLALMT